MEKGIWAIASIDLISLQQGIGLVLADDIERIYRRVESREDGNSDVVADRVPIHISRMTCEQHPSTVMAFLRGAGIRSCNILGARR